MVPKRRAALSTYIAVVVLIGMAAIAGVAYTVLSSQSTSSSTAGVSSTSSSSSVSTASSSLDAETSTAGPGSATETANSSLGLELTLSVNSTTIPSEDAISITTSVLNTLSTANNNNLTASNGWATDGLSSGPCDLGNSTNKLYYPVGVGIFKGTYGLNNLSSAGSPLSVWGLVECASYVVSIGSQYYSLSSITSYSLLPGSDNGTYAGYYGVSGSLTKGVSATRIVDQETISAANGTGFYNSLQSSLLANYTLVAGDEWGQVALLHFSVEASNNLPEVGSFLFNGGGCVENNNPVPCTISAFSQAFIFNCAAQAATASGCTAQVPSSGPWNATSYTITVHYPDTGQPGEPAGDNCMFSVPGDTGPPYAYCFMVNDEAFALSP